MEKARWSPLLYVYALRTAGAERSIVFYFYYFDPTGESFLFTLFALLTYAYHYLMTLIK